MLQTDLQSVKKSNRLISIVLVLMLICSALVSAVFMKDYFVAEDRFSEHKQYLDEKQSNVLALTAAAAAVSAGISALPDDMATPLAEKVADISSMLVVVLCALYLEKALLTLTGYASFSYLIPAGLVLYAAWLVVKIFFPDKYELGQNLKNFGIKLCVLGIAIFMLIPVSVNACRIVDGTYAGSVEETINAVDDTEYFTDGNKNDSTGIFSGLFSGVGNVVSYGTDKIKTYIKSLTDAVAMLITTSCIVPIITLLLFTKVINIVMGTNFRNPDMKAVYGGVRKRMPVKKTKQNAVVKK